MRVIRWILLLALLSLGARPVLAQEEPGAGESVTRKGTTVGQFLTLNVGARAQGLGGAYTALANDVTGLYWNPAGIAEVDRTTLFFHATDLVLNIDHYFVGAAIPFGGDNVIGFSGNILNVEDIQRTTEFLPNGDPFQPGFDVSDVAIGVTYARRMTDILSLGTTVKLVQERLDQTDVEYISFDVGTVFHTGVFGATLGFSVRHIGPDVALEGSSLILRDDFRINPTLADTTRLILETDEFRQPLEFRLGLVDELIGPEGSGSLIEAGQGHRLIFSGDLGDGIDTRVFVLVGVEYSFGELVYLRAGYPFYISTERLSFGGGLRLPVPVLGKESRVVFDYAYTDFQGDVLGNQNRYSVYLRF